MTIDAPRRTVPLRRLRLLGLIGPLVFVAGLLTARPLVIDALGLPAGHLTLGTALLLSAAGFGWLMYRLLGRAHDAVVEAERTSASLLERDRIAREMHDSLAQVLAVAHLRMCALGARPAIVRDERLRAEVDDLATLCREAHRDVREAIVGLKDAHRPERGLLDRLGDFVATFSRTSGIPTTLQVDLPGTPGLSPAAQVQVVRVVQEALANVRKHAGAERAQVRVTAHVDHTEFVVEDDGTGFDPFRSAPTDGFGLGTMRERTESVGGRFFVDSRPGRGTRIVAILPGGHGRPAAVPVEELSA